MTNVKGNTKFFVKLNMHVGTAGGTYCLLANHSVGNAWFGQFVSYIGGMGDYWNSNKLDTLKITGQSRTYPFFVNNSNTYHWMKEGCAIASTAMILRNMGATMRGYDFRTDFKGSMPADPFTVMLANCELDGTTMNPNTTSMNTGSEEPIYMYINRICERFNVSGRNISWGSVNLNETSLKKAVIDNGYVLVGFNYVTYNSEGKPIDNPHFMVITGFTDGDTFADRVLVCDPAAKSLAKGVGSNGLGVPLSETTSGYARMGIDNITSARYLTVL